MPQAPSKEVKLAALDNLTYFSKRILGFENSNHHKSWYQLLENDQNKRMVLLAPRNHGKSTCFSAVYPSWLIGKNPNIRVVIVSNAASQSEAFLRSIKSIVEQDANYKALFGDLKPKIPEKWTDREIIINRQTREKDPTISTVGAGGAILSKRADVIIVDDLLNKENTGTLEQRKKLKDWFNDILVPVLEPNGRLIWIATAFNSDDLSHDLLKDPTFDVKIKYKAIITEATNQDLWDQYRTALITKSKTEAGEFYESNKAEMEIGAEVLWGNRWSYKNLFDERISRGTRSFNLMYQNEAISSEAAIFQEEWVEKCKDPNRRLLDKFDQSQSDISIVTITQGVDLAIGEKENSDYTVITTLGKTQDEKVVLLNRVKGHFSPAEIRRNIKEQNDCFKPSLILVEDNGFQASMVKDLQGQSTAPIRGFTTTGEKYDENIGINSLAVAIENGQIILPADPTDPRTVACYEDLKEEMLKFPSGHTGDSLISMWFAWTALRSVSNVPTSIKIVWPDYSRGLRESTNRLPNLDDWDECTRE